MHANHALSNKNWCTPQSMVALLALYRHDGDWTVLLHLGCMDDSLHRPLRRHSGGPLYSQQIDLFGEMMQLFVSESRLIDRNF